MSEAGATEEQTSGGFSPPDIAREYLLEFDQLLGGIDLDALTRTVQRLRRARDRGATIFVAGNGGSAATAAHFVNDLGKATKIANRPPLRVMCLGENVSWLTALANDEGYARVFTGQMENFADRGDLLIVISASGNSPNLVHAVEYAKAHGVESIGILGFDGGVLKEQVEDAIWVASEIGAYGPVESTHVVICDIMTTCMMRDLANETL